MSFLNSPFRFVQTLQYNILPLVPNDSAHNMLVDATLWESMAVYSVFLPSRNPGCAVEFLYPPKLIISRAFIPVVSGLKEILLLLLRDPIIS